MIVLGLDLGTKCGWAVDGKDSPSPPRAGTYTLHTSGASRGPAFFRFQEWLYQKRIDTGADKIIYEAAIPVLGDPNRKIKMNNDTIAVLWGLVTCVQAICAAPPMVPCIPAHIASVRKRFVDHGRPDNPKKVVSDRCKLLGWPTGSYDMTDAIAVWYWGKTEFDRSFKLETGLPMFAGGPA